MPAMDDEDLDLFSSDSDSEADIDKKHPLARNAAGTSARKRRGAQNVQKHLCECGLHVPSFGMRGQRSSREA
eukprot:scaffold229977_cov31-Prasinocladus_malaysianus.AAC.1